MRRTAGTVRTAPFLLAYPCSHLPNDPNEKKSRNGKTGSASIPKQGNYGAVDREVVELIREDFTLGGEDEEGSGSGVTSVAEKMVLSSLRSLGAEERKKII